MSRAGSTSRAPSASWEDYSQSHSNSGISTPKTGKKRESKVTIKNQVYTVIDDEIQLPIDPRGEAKIDIDGNLNDGRRYKLSTFTSPMRASPTKLYMLSIDAARAAGFRDSLYFFRRNPLVNKLSCSQTEKDRLIELGKLSSNLKSRAVTMVSARNCFKVMGATFVVDGKYVIDDYYEDRAIAEGHKAGEPAWIETYDTEKDTGTLAQSKGLAPPGVMGTGLNVLHGHSGKPRPLLSADPKVGEFGVAVMSFGGAGLQPYGRSTDPSIKKPRLGANFTGTNWMHEYAKNVSETNSGFKGMRKSRLVEVKLGLSGEVEEEFHAGLEDAETFGGSQKMDLDSEGQNILIDNSLASTSKLSTAPSFHSAPIPNFQNPYPVASTSTLTSASSAMESSLMLPPSLPLLNQSKRKRKFYNPILGNYEVETNVPHVPSSTQSTTSEMERLDLVPRLFSEEKSKHGGAKLGIATFEVVLDGESRPPKSFLPGLFDFGVPEQVVAML